MSKTLFYCEKPSQARDYATVLEKEGAFKRENGYFESSKYIITWAFGHMMKTKQMQDYEDFNGWAWEAIPYYPKGDELTFYPNPNSESQVNIMKKQFIRNDVDLIINAGDAGREGELIFWEVYHYAKCDKPVKRMWISGLLEKDILDGLKDLKDDTFFEPIKDAAYTRQYADWLLGMNLTVGFSIKANMNRALHIGRVKTPTIAILANRRAEIENFVPKNYYELEANFGDKYNGKWFKDKLSETRFETEEEAKKIADLINGKNGKVVKKDVVEKKVKPKSLYNLSDLQAEANKKYGYTTTSVLDAAQVLYEKYKFASYPRTSSRHIGTAFVPELEKMLKTIKIPEYEKFIDEILDKGIKVNKSFVDDDKLGDHHAIVPTMIKPDLSSIQDEMKGGKVLVTKEQIKNVYDLIARRFISVFFEPAVYEETSIVTEVEGETFKTSGKIMKEIGWKKVYGKDDGDDEEEELNSKKKQKEEKIEMQTLPPIDLNEENQVKGQEMKPKETKPPKHYEEGQLVQIMENPRKLLDDDELKDVLKVTEAGLATEATRAGIIESIVYGGYAERKGKYMIATDLAMKMIQIAPESLRSPIVTAQWEQKLLDMEKRKYTKEEFVSELQTYVKEVIEELQSRTLDVSFENEGNKGEIVGVCPICKGKVKETRGTFKCDTPDCLTIFKKIAQKEIKITQVKQLLTKGETSMLRGFKNKEGKSFAAKLVIRGGEVKLETSSELEIKCPKCEANLVGTEKVVKCPNEDSHLVLFTTIAGKKISEKDIKKLVENGETDLIKGFVSKKGSKFDAKLKLNDTGKTEFVFEERKAVEKKETDIKCPLCGGAVTDNGKAFGCENWKEKDCKFVAWKVMSGRPMSAKDYQKILESPDMKTESKLEGFVSKAGKPYGAIVKYNKENKRFEFVFE